MNIFHGRFFQVERKQKDYWSMLINRAELPNLVIFYVRFLPGYVLTTVLKFINSLSSLNKGNLDRDRVWVYN